MLSKYPLARQWQTRTKEKPSNNGMTHGKEKEKKSKGKQAF